MPRFADYHRTVVGYHGVRRSVALEIVQGAQDSNRSENPDDWLGHGVYFWEYAPKQAWAWADQRRLSHGWDEEVAVLASMIRLANCFDLLDPDHLRELSAIRQQYERTENAMGRAPKQNYNKSKHLDCAVFQFAYAVFEAEGSPIDTCRAVFGPSHERMWNRSGVYKNAHIQLCVRNPACILGTWLVRPQ